MSLALAGLVLAAIALPHVVALDRTSPLLAASIWLCALALRGLIAVFAVLLIVLFVPTTAVFTAVTHWCWHTVLPMVASHLPLDGHTVGAVALVLPAFALAGSVLGVVVGLWRATRSVRDLLSRTSLGSGPGQSVLLSGGEVLVAAAGLRRPRVVVSAGALLALDDEELAAGLAHERGHIAHRHRWVLVAAELCRALARFVPGTQAARRELLFHLERDADRFAVARCHDPAVLAAAICKAAQSGPHGVVATGLGGGVVVRRVRQLLEADEPRRAGSDSSLRVVAVVMAALVLAGATAVPAVAHAGLHSAAGATLPAHDCPD